MDDHSDDRGGMRRDAATDIPPTRYDRASVRRPRAARFAGAATGVGVLGIEICQSVQALDNSVPLVALKPTMVRVYLDETTVAASLRLRGELCLRQSATGPATYLAGINELKLDPAEALGIDDKRENLKASLNFHLPETALQAGPLIVELNRLIQIGGADQPFTGAAPVAVELIAGPPIRVRCIGLRYIDPQSGGVHVPDAIHFDYFRSYLSRAYPVPAVEWSQIVVDANFAPPFQGATAVLANAQIAAIRNSEINSGTDPRTHYYGLVDDANGQHFMRGRASGIPAGPQPDTVASGPCGIPAGFAGDQDQSYADWYGAHELGHTYGRFHPGFPPGAQDASDPAFPFANGQLSNADRKYVGYDVGDPQLGLKPKVMNGTTHHDVMTYADRQWVSAYTFEAIRQRLADEDAQFAPPVA
ncbi:hypothetical protein JF540_05675 [Salipiger thiooxidans]|uniref:hypothetical protein n=1 Tax=Salipiger thiooxidans TaxID=282683 RepID=UPI001A8E8F48|nr:hypothetical protein [Salipiger thiooxidans]MBN8186171.1 hypothetical protein [Salipiger thiooxidans]